MPLFSNPEREHQEKLKKFRANFLFLINDGAFPPHRQQRLFQWCKKWELDWEEARRFIMPDATRFLDQVVRQVVGDHQITPNEIAGLRRLQRRLSIPDQQDGPLQRLYDLVEQKLEALILERAAYLSAEPTVASLQDLINSYELPSERAIRLEQLLARQHELAKLMAGILPIEMPTVSLYKDELCHLEIPVTFAPFAAPAKATYTGHLIATNHRFMLLAVSGGFATAWPDLQTIALLSDSLQIRGKNCNGTLYCQDSQYVATLLSAARKLYTPRPSPVPLHPDRKLPALG